MAMLITQYSRDLSGRDVSQLPLTQRANLWVIYGSTGNSSLQLWGGMVGAESEDRRHHHPGDFGDFNRCLLLLEAVPEWKSRIGEMASQSIGWSIWAEHWEALTNVFLEEHGLNFNKSSGDEDKSKTEKARALLESVRKEVIEAYHQKTT